MFESDAWKEESIKFAVTKAVTPQWHQIFLKAIGGKNELVKLHIQLRLMLTDLQQIGLSAWQSLWQYPHARS